MMMKYMVCFVVVCLLFICGQCFHTNEIRSETYKKLYFASAMSVNFTEARRLCEQQNSTPLELDYEMEFYWIYHNLLRPSNIRGGQYWLGATPVGRGETVTQWLTNDAKIVVNRWNRTSAEKGATDCNALAMYGVSYNLERCSNLNPIICQRAI